MNNKENQLCYINIRGTPKLTAFILQCTHHKTKWEPVKCVCFFLVFTRSALVLQEVVELGLEVLASELLDRDAIRHRIPRIRVECFQIINHRHVLLANNLLRVGAQYHRLQQVQQGNIHFVILYPSSWLIS